MIWAWIFLKSTGLKLKRSWATSSNKGIRKGENSLVVVNGINHVFWLQIILIGIGRWSIGKKCWSNQGNKSEKAKNNGMLHWHFERLKSSIWPFKMLLIFFHYCFYTCQKYLIVLYLVQTRCRQVNWAAARMMLPVREERNATRSIPCHDTWKVFF